MPNNMGLVRYILAIAVFVSHFDHLGGYLLYFPVTSYAGVGGFFALSGFLIYGSYLRSPSVGRYLISRAVRLLPAYFITIIFFACLLSLLSTLTAASYFTSSGFWAYLAANLTFLNFLHPSLPGVFDGLAVNGSLWTMKIEWCLYLTPPLVAWVISRLHVRPVIVFIAIYILAVGYRIIFYRLYLATDSEIYYILSRQFLGQLSFFYVGVLCYYFIDHIMRYRWYLLIIAASLLFGSRYIPYGSFIFHPFAIGVLVVWFSMALPAPEHLIQTGKKAGRLMSAVLATIFGRRDNISYHIYLIHAPVIQIFVTLRGSSTVSAPTAFIICFTSTVILSWLLNRLTRTRS
ncbi:MAG: acyltransferase [Duncaniella sp.]|nr:acyltransferase [Duncaniella sp.]